MLEKALIEEIKNILLAERKRLMSEAVKTLSGLHSATESLPDFSDRSSLEMEQGFLLKLRERERKFIQKIDEALDRIEDGSFGKCEDCKRDIGIKRIKARPTVTMCIECKTEEERKEKLKGV